MPEDLDHFLVENALIGVEGPVDPVLRGRKRTTGFLVITSAVWRGDFRGNHHQECLLNVDQDLVGGWLQPSVGSPGLVGLQSSPHFASGEHWLCFCYQNVSAILSLCNGGAMSVG